METWKSITGYEGMYEVSDQGRVKSLGSRFSNNRADRYLKHGITRDGYCTIVLCKDGKMYGTTIHKLVASHFIENSQNRNEINHIDENKENNCVGNLEWCTRSENVSHSQGQKIVLTKDGRDFQFRNLTIAALETGCSREQLSKLVRASRNCNGYLLKEIW